MKRALHLFIGAAAMTLLCGWTPSKSTLDSPILAPDGDGQFDTGITVRQLAQLCAKSEFSKPVFERAPEEAFVYRCIRRDPLSQRSASESIFFKASILGHHPAVYASEMLLANGERASSAFIKARLVSLADDLHAGRKADPIYVSTPLAWSPPINVQDGSVQMLFQNEFRDTLVSPKDIATTCVKYRNGQISYEEGKENSFYITCRIPQQKTVDGHTIRFHLFISPQKFDGNHFSVLAAIHTLAPTQARGWVQFNGADRTALMKSIRDLLLDDDTIKDIPEGQDAFGYWRVCKNKEDEACYRRLLP